MDIHGMIKPCSFSKIGVEQKKKAVKTRDNIIVDIYLIQIFTKL